MAVISPKCNYGNRQSLFNYPFIKINNFTHFSPNPSSFITHFLRPVEAFCAQWGIDLKFNLVALGLDKSIDQCPAGSIALYCRHFEFSNLRHPFSIFVLNVLEYYRISFGQIHPRDLARVLHFESICRAAGSDSSLLSFCHFFRLAKNGDWFTFETSQVDTCLISSMVTILGSWKDRFFWVFDSIIPFKMIWRHPDAVLHELEPSDSELDSWFLKSIRACPSRLCPFPEPLLVLMGISKLWFKPDVVFTDAASTEGEDVVVRGSEHRFERSGYVSVPNIKRFVKVAASKASTRRSTRRKGVGQRSSSETIDLGDDLEIYEDLEVPTDGKKWESPLVVAKDNKALGKKVGGLKPSGKAIERSSNVDPGEIYVPDWKVTVSDSFKSLSICEDVLTHFAPTAVRTSSSSMDDDHMIAKMIMGACNLCALLPEGISRFRKRMQEYEAFSKKKKKKKREAMKVSMAALKKESEGFAEKEKAWQMKVHELNQRHEVKVGELKKQVEASSSSSSIRVYNTSQSRQLNIGDSFCLYSKDPVWFNLNKIAPESNRYEEAFVEI
ncbi:hypothetical protein Hdeb2414_s0012g00392651 [Helianthus debilis subsp. tardiflorus]